MLVLSGDERAPDSTVVAVGKFVVVHLGHRALLARVQEAARRLGAAPAVVTFDRHPMHTIAPHRAPSCELATLDQRLAQLEEAGVKVAMVLEFTTQVASMEAEAFVERILRDRMGARAVVAGADFRFGHGRRGTPEMLEAMGVDVEVLDLVHVGAEEISSTAIRERVASGDVAAAAKLWGRPYAIAGEVVHGAHRGVELGFPTANLRVDPRACLPRFGIYAGWWRWRKQRLRGAISIGTTPQFDDVLEPKVEVHILDFDDRLYGERGELEFVARLRDEMVFPSVDELRAQIGRDVARTRELLD